jgi:hypothetical protein
MRVPLASIFLGIALVARCPVMWHQEPTRKDVLEISRLCVRFKIVARLARRNVPA